MGEEKFQKHLYIRSLLIGIFGGFLGLHDLYLQNTSRFLIRLLLCIVMFLVPNEVGAFIMIGLFFWWVYDLFTMKSSVARYVKMLKFEFNLVFEPLSAATSTAEYTQKDTKTELKTEKIPLTANASIAIQNKTKPVLATVRSEAKPEARNDQDTKPTSTEKIPLVIYDLTAPVELHRRANLPDLIHFPLGGLLGEAEIFKPGSEVEKWIEKDRPRFLFVDIETTGFSPQKDKILEIALALFALDDGKLHLVRSYVGWEDPGESIPWPAARVNGLRNSFLVGQKINWSIVKSFFEISDFAIGHNAYEFDARFLKPWLPFFDHWVDTMYFPWNTVSMKLTEILKSLGLPTNMSHSALYDVLSLAKSLQTVRNGTLWLEEHFHQKRKTVIENAFEGIRDEIFKNTEKTKKDTFVFTVGDKLFGAKITSNNQIRWYNADGASIKKQDVEEEIWKAYLERRNEDILKQVKILK